MIEGRYMSFLASQLDTKSRTLPQSATQQEIVVLVAELRETVDVIYAGAEVPKRTPQRRHNSSTRTRLSNGGEVANGGTPVQRTGDNSRISSDGR